MSVTSTYTTASRLTLSRTGIPPEKRDKINLQFIWSPKLNIYNNLSKILLKCITKLMSKCFFMLISFGLSTTVLALLLMTCCSSGYNCVKFSKHKNSPENWGATCAVLVPACGSQSHVLLQNSSWDQDLNKRQTFLVQLGIHGYWITSIFFRSSEDADFNELKMRSPSKPCQSKSFFAIET